MKWDAAAVAAALSSRNIDPVRAGDALLAAWPYLTRMFTTISPGEMTADPEFWEHDGLPDVRVPGNAVRRITCSNASGMTLPDGRPVALTPQSTWPGFSTDMPFAERIEEFTSRTGTPLVWVDNTELINSKLKAWNDSHGWPPPPVGTGTGSTGAGGNDTGGQSTGGGAGTFGSGTSGADTTGTATSGAGCGSLATDMSTPAAGCGYRTARFTSTPPRWALAIRAALIALHPRHRARGGPR